MSPTVTIVLIIVVLVIVAAIAYGVQAGRRKKLQSTFGPEYDRAVADTGDRGEAEKELRERAKRHAELELKPLSPESQATYSAAWEEVQIQFVDNPTEAVTTADELVTRLITERGYPTGDYDSKLADLSVEHAGTLQQYRDAHEISQRSAAGEADTEDLRKALVHYRALFAELLGADPVPSASAPSSSASTASRTPASTGTTTTDDAPIDEPTDEPAPTTREAADDTPTTAPDTTR